MDYHFESSSTEADRTLNFPAGRNLMVALLSIFSYLFSVMYNVLQMLSVILHDNFSYFAPRISLLVPRKTCLHQSELVRSLPLLHYCDDYAAPRGVCFL